MAPAVCAADGVVPKDSRALQGLGRRFLVNPRRDWFRFEAIAKSNTVRHRK
jgi:hypothetical protein